MSRVCIRESLAKIAVCANQSESGARRSVIVIELQDEVVLVRCQAIVATTRRDFGDSQQFGDVFPSKSVNTLDGRSSRLFGCLRRSIASSGGLCHRVEWRPLVAFCRRVWKRCGRRQDGGLRHIRLSRCFGCHEGPGSIARTHSLAVSRRRRCTGVG